MTSRLNPITTPRHELRAEKARRNKEAALAAFIGKKAEIDEMLARLQIRLAAIRSARRALLGHEECSTLSEDMLAGLLAETDHEELRLMRQIAQAR